MAHLKADREFDEELQHRAPSAAALTATTTLDTIAQRGKTKTVFATRFVVESIDVTTGDETYDLVVEGSNDSFTTVELLASYQMGDASQLLQTDDTPVGFEHDLLWSTEVNGVTFEDARIRLVCAGTTPSMGIHCYSSRI